MNDDSSADPTCRICGGPVRWDNRLQICRRTDACTRERTRLRNEARARAEADAIPERPFPKCKLPGCPKKRGAHGYCYMHWIRVQKHGDPGPVGRIKGERVLRAGDVFNSWTALEDYVPPTTRVLCRCVCGTERPVAVDALAKGGSRSCGCQSNGKHPLRRRADNPYLPAGATFARLTLLEAAIRSTDMVLCRCECGSEVRRNAATLKSGNTKSCGCYRKKHGLSGHPLYYLWTGIVQRTTNPDCKSYPDYGGRGVGLCERWQGLPDGLLNFAADVGERPPGTTLDRKDNDRGYEPSNVQWATAKQQSNNKRSVAALTRERDALQARLDEVMKTLAAQPRRTRPAAQEATLF